MPREFTLDIIEQKKDRLFVTGLALTEIAVQDEFSQLVQYGSKQKSREQLASLTLTVETIIVDGYVQLDDDGKAGLGMYLYDSLNQKIPIIGVAKRGFKDNVKHVIEVTRGKSNNPLYVTAIGIGLQDSADKIKNMAGKYRMPDLLKILDQKTKEE